MTRKDWEKIESVFRNMRRLEDRNVKIPEYPSAEWTRRRIATAIADAFELTGEARALYSRMAGIEER